MKAIDVIRERAKKAETLLSMSECLNEDIPRLCDALDRTLDKVDEPYKEFARVEIIEILEGKK